MKDSSLRREKAESYLLELKTFELVGFIDRTDLPIFDMNEKTVRQFVLNRREIINYPDKDGNTPLHHTTINTMNILLMRILLQEGAGSSINKRNKIGQTPLDMAKSLYEERTAPSRWRKKAEYAIALLRKYGGN